MAKKTSARAKKRPAATKSPARSSAKNKPAAKKKVPRAAVEADGPQRPEASW